jgi:hypothetical protein
MVAQLKNAQVDDPVACKDSLSLSPDLPSMPDIMHYYCTNKSSLAACN